MTVSSSTVVRRSATDSSDIQRWPSETREAAYQIYANGRGRTIPEAARALEERGWGVVPVQTLYRWREVDGWDHRKREETLAVTLGYPESHVLELAVAGAEAVEFLAAIARGEAPHQKAGGQAVNLNDRIRAAIHIESAARSIILANAKIGAKTSSRLGNTRGKPLGSPDTPDISTMNSEQLEQFERQYRQQRERESSWQS